MGRYGDITPNSVIGVKRGTPFVWKLEGTKEMPSKKKMAKNIFKTAKDSISSALKGNGLKADADTIRKRKAICNDCSYFVNERCSQCGCYLRYKAFLEKEKCPAGKW